MTEKPDSSKPKNKKMEDGWFDVDEDHNTNVYVSNLPLDTTEEEFIELMKKCGLLMKDIDTGKFKIKLYKDESGNFKGDALCNYIKIESVDLALQILDGYPFKNKIISVERAVFKMKGEYDPNKKPRKRKGKEKRRIKEKMERLFDWRPERLPGERSNCEKTVIIKNMFDISEFEKDPGMILEYQTDMKEECTQKCGEVKKAEVQPGHPEGVVIVTFKDFEAADKCVSLMDHRYFAGRQLTAFHWDGRTKYKIQETEEEAEERIKKWNKYLEED